MEVRQDVVIRGDLRDGSGAAGPAITEVNTLRGEVVIGIVEGMAVRFEPLCAQNRVVEDALHAVAVASVARDTQQVARELEVRVAAAGSFKAGMRFAEAVEQLARAWFHETLVRSPSAGGKALRGDHSKAIFRRVQVLLAAGG